jgi:hypothetical protein
MLRTLKLMAIALAMVCVAEPAIAQFKPGNRATVILSVKKSRVHQPEPELAARIGDFTLRAAPFAKADYPGSRFSGKTEGRGVYIVTLVAESNNMIRRQWTAMVRSIVTIPQGTLGWK